uniref:Uncharacterized protein n=1 Tax=Kalanchoe fedtschenkoi TaxID=63787 RepID=A0A7N0RCS5_KALFE
MICFQTVMKLLGDKHHLVLNSSKIFHSEETREESRYKNETRYKVPDLMSLYLIF